MAWCRDSLTLRPELCTVSTTISPEGVWRSPDGRQTLAGYLLRCRGSSFGIPAWIDRVTGNLFYRHAGKDVPVDFDAAGNRELETGRLQLNYAPIPRLDDPEYFRHFSLSRFDGQSFSLLNYPISSGGASLFRAPADLEIRLLYACDGQPARQRQRAGERVVLQRPSGQYDRNEPDDARQFGGGSRDREFRFGVEIH